GTAEFMLFRVHSIRGDLAEAERWCLAALEIRERAFGPQAFQVCEVLLGLSRLQMAANPDRAEAAYQRVLAAAPGMPDSHRTPWGVSGLSGLGGLPYHQGKYDASRVFFRQALELAERHLPADYPLTVQTCQGLAATHYAAGELSDAEQCLERAILMLR